MVGAVTSRSQQVAVRLPGGLAEVLRVEAAGREVSLTALIVELLRSSLRLDTDDGGRWVLLTAEQVAAVEARPGGDFVRKLSRLLAGGQPTVVSERLVAAPGGGVVVDPWVAVGADVSVEEADAEEDDLNGGYPW